MNAIHVWDGPYLFFRREGLKVTGNYINRRVTDENDFQFPDEPVNRAIGISLLVGFFPEVIAAPSLARALDGDAPVDASIAIGAPAADVTFVGVDVELHD